MCGQGVHARAERAHLAVERPDLVAQAGGLLLAGGDLLRHRADAAGQALDLLARSLGLPEARLERSDAGGQPAQLRPIAGGGLLEPRDGGRQVAELGLQLGQRPRHGLARPSRRQRQPQTSS